MPLKQLTTAGFQKVVIQQIDDQITVIVFFSRDYNIYFKNIVRKMSFFADPNLFTPADNAN